MGKLHKLAPSAINYGSATNGSVTTPENSRSTPKRAETGTPPNDTNVTTVKLAAAALGLKPGTLNRRIREGCPVVRAGRDGRGNGTLVHVPTVRAWLAARQQPGQPVEVLLLTLASELPHVIGAALDVAGRVLDTPAKAELLRMLPGVWFLASTAVRDHLVELGCPEQRDLTRDDMPAALARLLDSELQSKR